MDLAVVAVQAVDRAVLQDIDKVAEVVQQVEEAVDPWAEWANVFIEGLKVIILTKVDDVEEVATDPFDSKDSSERH